MKRPTILPLLAPTITRSVPMPATVKQNVIEMIERLPDDASVEDIMAELFFRRKVDEGLRELDAGQGVDHEEAKQQLAKWLN